MRGRRGAALGLALLAAACSAALPSQPEASEPVPVPSTAGSPSSTAGAASSLSVLAGDMTVGQADVRSRAVPSRTADAVGPFGMADLWIGAGPLATGLQRSLGPGDTPGPLLTQPSARPGFFRVYDMCGVTEVSFREGSDFLSVVYRYGYDTARRFHKGCIEGRFMALVNSHWIGVAGGPYSEQRYFERRDQAEAWLGERRDAHYQEKTQAERNGTVPSASPYGFYESVGRNFGSQSAGGPFGIVFAPADAPVDEVTVVEGSVAVSGGVLRGLVRNWSRRLWAYGVEVCAGGDCFGWPLSVQPGELAPFEIAGWDGPADPDRIRISVDADMSWHFDPSRAWGNLAGTPSRVLVSDLTARPMRDSVRSRYGHVAGDVPVGSVSVGAVELDAPLSAPKSHLSLRSIEEDIAVGDLRGYGAVVDPAGRVIDVGPAPAVKLTEWDEATYRFRGHEEITSLPHPLAMNHSAPQLVCCATVLFDIHPVHDGLAADGHEIGKPGEGYSTDVLFDDEFIKIGPRSYPLYGVLHGAYIIWIGAAHPQRDAPQG